MSSRIQYQGPPEKFPRPLPHVTLQPRKFNRIKRAEGAALERMSEWQRLIIRGPQSPLNSDAAHALALSISGYAKPVTFQIALEPAALDVGLIVKRTESLELTRLFRGAMPECEINVVDDIVQRVNAPRLTGTIARTSRADYLAFKEIKGFGAAEPYSALFEAFHPLHDRLGESAEVRFVIQPVSPTRYEQISKQMTYTVNPFLAFLMQIPRGPYPRFSPELQKRYEARLFDQPLFDLRATITLSGTDRSSLWARAMSVTRAFGYGFNVGPGGFELVDWHWTDSPRLAFVIAPEFQEGTIVNASELAALIHVPGQQVANVPGVSFLKRGNSRLSPKLLTTHGFVLGRAKYRGEDVGIRIPMTDLQRGPLVPLGATGQGKSVFTTQLAAQILAHPSQPAALVEDPAFDLIDALCAVLPPERREDTVCFDLNDVDWPVGMPLFRGEPGIPLDQSIDNTYALLRLLFAESWSDSRMGTIIWIIVATLMTRLGSTLLDVPRLLHQREFRRKTLAAHITDPMLLFEWAAWDAMSEGARQEAARPVLYRLNRRFRSKPIRNMLCRTDGPSLPTLLNTGKICLVSSAGSNIQSEANLLLELWLAQANLGLQARLGTDLPRHPTLIVIDEAPRFRGATLPLLIRETRKAGAITVLCTQEIGALGEALSEAVLSNLATLVAFQCGPDDARRLASHLKPFTADDVQSLDPHEAIVRMAVDRSRVEPFVMKTLPLEHEPDHQAFLEIRDQTRQRFARPRAEVEQELERKQARLGLSDAGPESWRIEDVDEA